jgi:hypothetical protein
MDIGSESLRIAGGEIVEPTNLMPLPGKLIGKRRAEESRGSGNQKVHK